MRETVRDVVMLHNESFFAAAQKKHVYIYDKHGLEVHCLRVRTKSTSHLQALGLAVHRKAWASLCCTTLKALPQLLTKCAKLQFTVLQPKHISMPRKPQESCVCRRATLSCVCVQEHTSPRRLEFLPYHFLLASVGQPGVLHYQVRHLAGSRSPKCAPY